MIYTLTIKNILKTLPFILTIDIKIKILTLDIALTLTLKLNLKYYQ
jgi:hypothetical protein